MTKFLEITKELELYNIPLEGGGFTGRGGLNNVRASCIDRFLFNREWGELGGEIVPTYH